MEDAVIEGWDGNAAAPAHEADDDDDDDGGENDDDADVDNAEDVPNVIVVAFRGSLPALNSCDMSPSPAPSSLSPPPPPPLPLPSPPLALSCKPEAVSSLPSR